MLLSTTATTTLYDQLTTITVSFSLFITTPTDTDEMIHNPHYVCDLQLVVVDSVVVVVEEVAVVVSGVNIYYTKLGFFSLWRG